MAYRKRDNGTGYSSADVYRSVPTNTPAFTRSPTTPTSSDEDAHLTSPIVSPLPTPAAAPYRHRTGSRSRTHRESNGTPGVQSQSPLSPPRPQFLGSDRGSWSSGASEPEPGSDSDNSGANFAGVGALGRSSSTPAARQPQVVRPLPNVAAAGSDRMRSTRPRAGPGAPATPGAHNQRRRSSMANEIPIHQMSEDTAAQRSNTDYAPGGATASGSAVDSPRSSFYGVPPPVPEKKSPPSSYAFPFQSHPGNPDPGTSIPGVGRRASLESISGNARTPSNNGHAANVPPSASANALLTPNSATGTSYPQGNAGGYGPVVDVEELGRPFAPFMGEGIERTGTPPSPARSITQVYRNSAAGALYGDGTPGLPRTSSTANMRAPFLSPASRPTSSLWSPPSYPYSYPPGNGSSTALGYGSSYGAQYPSYADIQAQLRKAKPVMPSTRLPQKLTKEDKPWHGKKDGRDRWAYWVTLIGIFCGIIGGGVLIYFNYTYVYLLTDSEVCTVFTDDFSSLDTSIWTRDVELGGFNAGQFHMTTSSSDNSYVSGGNLYIKPTLTSDSIGFDSVLDGYTYTLSDCTVTDNTTACEAISSNSTGAVIEPVMSARLTTKDSYTIKYGRVEVEAKLPSGDWLWPQIFMLPLNDTYGSWPQSGEIDIMEARGNPITYSGGGVNYVRSTIFYGILDSLTASLYGWRNQKQTGFNAAFHTYVLEWTDSWMRMYVDTRLNDMIELRTSGHDGKSFWDRGDFPDTALNGSSEIAVENIWADGGANAPFDQEFYLVIDLAAGGTNGWFPDDEGDKPWYDSSDTAMREFAVAQDTWYASWPTDDDELAFRIQKVTMSKLC